jgi:hypothetical protein
MTKKPTARKAAPKNVGAALTKSLSTIKKAAGPRSKSSTPRNVI